MSHDPLRDSGDSADPTDASLSALYRTHLGDGATDAGAAARPSPDADARIRALSRARTAPAAGRQQRRADSGWRSWIAASWFKPSLAFATLASLSVVIVALMPRDDLNIERAERAPAKPDSRAPGVQQSAPPAAQPAESMPARPAESRLAKPAAPANSSAPSADSARRAERDNAASTTVMAEPVQQPKAARSKSRPADSRPADSRAADSASPSASTPATLKPNPFPGQSAASDRRTDRSSEPARSAASMGGAPGAALGAASAPRVSANSAGSSASSASTGSSASSAPAMASSAGTAPPGGLALSPPPAPASTQPAPAKQAAGTLAAAADAAPAMQRLDKASNLGESNEYRGGAPALPEVRDSAPSYPNEFRPSIPLPNTYMPPRQRSQNAMVARKEDGVQKRSVDVPSMASTAPPPRDPAEWIKIILKLKAEGKTEQVTKELVEFRKVFPAYQLPEELKPLAAK